MAGHRSGHARAPEDFTSFLGEDYPRLPDTVHLYARSVGVQLVGWWRNYWLLNTVEMGTRHSPPEQSVV